MVQIASSRDLENEFATMQKPFEVCQLNFLCYHELTIRRAENQSIIGLLVNVPYSACGECLKAMFTTAIPSIF